MDHFRRFSEFNRLISTIRTVERISLNYEIEDESKSEFCNCRHFSKDLTNLFKEIVSERNKSFKWKIFANFIRKHSWNYHKMFSIDGTAMPKHCSLKVCSVLLNRFDSLLRCGFEVPTILKTVKENFGNITNCVIDDLEDNLSSLESREASGTLAALRDHSNFANLLLKFDFISCRRDDSPGFDMTSYGMIRCFVSMWTRGHRSTYMTREAVSHVEKVLFYINRKERSKRMFWAAVAIRATQLSLKNVKSIAKDFVSFLKAYFAATTDPFLTLFEVRSLLYACFSALNKLDLFDIYSQEFDKLMPECPVEREPRKLADLARCQVRENCSNCSLPLPSAVQQLHLPDTLKSFVLGENPISRKRKNDPSQDAAIKEKLARLI